MVFKAQHRNHTNQLLTVNVAKKIIVMSVKVGVESPQPLLNYTSLTFASMFVSVCVHFLLLTVYT